MFEEILGETGGTIAQFALALIVVVLLIFLIAWAVKRLGLSRIGGHQGDEAQLEILTSLAIDPKRKLVLVRHGRLEHLLLIGGGSDEVVERSMVSGIPLAARMQASKSQEREEEKQRPAERFRSSGRFSSLLSRSRGDDGASSSSSAKPASGQSEGPDGTGAAVAGLATAASAQTTPARTEVETPSSTAPIEATKTLPLPPKNESLSKPSATQASANDPSKSAPAPQDEREAIQQSLDAALSESLLSDSDTDASPAKSKPSLPTIDDQSQPPLSPEKLAAEDPGTAILPPAPTPAIDTLDLERELEAALEEDGLLGNVETPSNNSPADTETSLPPLPNFSDLIGTQVSDSGQQEAGSEPAAPASDVRPQATAPLTAASEDDAEPDPLKLSTIRSQAKAKSDAEDDIPVALSGRADPPIPVSIPSRGPASNATTLAHADDLPGSSETQPGSDTTKDAPSPTTPDDLDDEMKRLLGEIAGGPDQK